MSKAIGFAAFTPTEPLREHRFDRREPLERDVEIEILYCGVCHSDLHTVRSEWAGTIYPCIPGHEIVGRVTRTGAGVTRFSEGDVVAVGCMVDSCGHCDPCKEGLEQFCDNGAIFTYNSADEHTGKTTYGGYSSSIVVTEEFVLKVPANLDPAAAAPLLCAGITTYSPLRHWNVGKNQKVGVVGLGGLGHMAVKFANAFGAEVVLFTTSESKIADAKRLGAHDVVISKNRDEMKKHTGSFDFIVDTVAVSHNLDTYLAMLRRNGTMCLVGVPENPHPSPSAGMLIGRRRSLAGSLIGGIPETQEMLDFCAANGIVSDIEMIPMQGINEAYERMVKSDVKYRFVIDMGTLRQQ